MITGKILDEIPVESSSNRYKTLVLLSEPENWTFWSLKTSDLTTHCSLTETSALSCFRCSSVRTHSNHPAGRWGELAAEAEWPIGPGASHRPQLRWRVLRHRHPPQKPVGQQPHNILTFIYLSCLVSWFTGSFVSQEPSGCLHFEAGQFSGEVHHVQRGGGWHEQTALSG